MTDQTATVPKPATMPPATTPATTELTAAWGQYLTTALVEVASPISSTVAFFWQMYAPGLLLTLLPPSEVHDLFMSLFSEIETISRGSALTVAVHSGVVADVLKILIGKFPAFETWLLTETDPWIKEELQSYGILPKS